MKNNSEFIALWTHLCTFEETRFLTQPPRKKKKRSPDDRKNPRTVFFRRRFENLHPRKTLGKERDSQFFWGGELVGDVGKRLLNMFLCWERYSNSAFPFFLLRKTWDTCLSPTWQNCRKRAVNIFINLKSPKNPAKHVFLASKGGKFGV